LQGILGRVLGIGAVAAVFALALSSNAQADAVADFYKGKRITILIGFGAGGGYDTTTRLVSRHFGRHVPGNPTIVPQNMPGSGSLKVLNHLYNQPSLRDGATLGVFNSAAVLEPLYGNKKAQFDAKKLSWIGSMHSDVQACAVWKGAGVGIKTLQDMIKSKKTIVFGSTGPAAPTSLFPLYFKNALGAPIKVITGYKGTKDVNLAMHRGEVDGTCGMFESTVRGAYFNDFKSGDLRMFVQVSMGLPVPDIFKDATPVVDLLTTPELKQTGRLVFGPSALTRPLSAPPAVPGDRLAALRKALLDTMKDPALIADGKKIKVEFKPIPGETFAKMIEEFYATPPEVVKKAYAFSHDR
jgi:tripartite-type tricarboxylate transporter receptor subunit TctC